MSEAKVKSIRVKGPTARLAFPQLKEPKQYQGKGKAWYSAAFLFDKEVNLADPAEGETLSIKSAVKKAIQEAHGMDRKKWPKDIKFPWKDGDEKGDYNGYAGTNVINAKTDQPPLLANKQAKKVEDASMFYPGCFVNPVFNVKCVQSGSDWYVTCYLQAIQFAEDGERLDGGLTDPGAVFSPVKGSEASEDDFEDDDLDVNNDEDNDDDFEL